MIDEPINDGILSKTVSWFTVEKWEESTCCDSQTSHKVVDDSPHKSLHLELGGKPSVQSKKRNSDKNDDMQPIQMFVPV